MGKKLLAFISLLIIAIAGCSDDVEPPNGVSNLPPKPESPRGLTASIGNNQVVLKWAITNAAAIDQFVIYFSDSSAFDMVVFDSTTLTSDTVDGLVNGRTYFFRVSSIDTAGIEGDKSSAVTASPGIFSILIEDGKEFTNIRQINVDLTAPSEVSLVQLSENTDFSGAHWEIYTNKKTFTLSDGDGLKTVYARFELGSGGYSVDIISDDITLDRTAVIDDIKIYVNGAGELTSNDVLSQGDILRFEVHVSEKGSAASVAIAGLGDIELNDFGIDGDNLADDTVYGAEYIIPDDTEVSDAVIKASFTDVAGNQAPDLTSDVRLNVSSLPSPVTVWGYAKSSLEIQLLWTPTDISDFLEYRVFRAEYDSIPDSVLPYTDSTMVIQIVKAVDSKYLDGGLEENTDYYYWIYLDDTHGNVVRSNTVKIRTLPNEPPDPVTIIAVATADTLSAKISWASASQSEDFEAYYILRDVITDTLENYTENSGYPEDLIIEFIDDQQTTSYVDRTLPDSGTYYYQVYVVDKQGMVGRSNLDSVYIK